MLISRNDPLSSKPSTTWRLASVGVAALVVALATMSGGVRPVAGQQAKTPPEKSPASEAGAPVANSATTSESQPAEKTAESSPVKQLPIVGRLFTSSQETPAATASAAEEQDLRAKLAAAQQQIRALEEQLRALGAQRQRTDAKLAPPGGIEDQTTSNTVTLTRVNEDGSISTEEWSTGPDGKPEKIRWKKVTHSQAESPFAAAKPAEVRDGQVVKEYKDKQGQVVIHVYDRATGRLLETRRGEVPADPTVPQAEGTPANVKPATRPPLATARSPSSGVERVGEALDLVNLATAYADAVSAVETAQANLAATEEAAANKVVSTRELETARLALRGAQRKYELLRNIATVAVQHAKDDLNRARQLVSAGAASTNLAAEAESRWKMVDSILQSDPGEAKEQLPGLPGKAP